MAFDNNGYNTIGGHSRKGTAIQVFTYKTNDTLADIFTDGYFNELRHKVKKDDLIFVHREDTDGQNAADLILKITLAPITENITVGNAMSDDWSDDGEKLTPLIDGRDVSTGSGDFITNDATINGLDASKIVHTDGDKKLVSIDINTAYNKDLSDATPQEDTDSGSAGTSEDISRADHAHPKTQATEAVIGQSERATQTETNDGTDDLRHITPLKLSGRTATETRTGIAEIATQAETNAETDDLRIVTPLKLAGKKASQAEAEAATDNTKIMTPLRTKQFADANLALKRVIIENDTTDPTNDIKFNSGRMFNNAKTLILNLPTYIKQLDVTFAKGNNQGMRASGVSHTANTWYHLFGITEDSTGDEDYYADTSFAASNIPSGWSNPVWINAIKTDGSIVIYPFLQIGQYTFWKSPQLNFSGAPSTTASLKTVSVPPGKKFLALYSLWATAGGANSNNIHYISDPDGTDETPTATNVSVAQAVTDGNSDYGGTSQTITDASSQLRLRSAQATGGTVYLALQGYKILEEL